MMPIDGSTDDHMKTSLFFQLTSSEAINRTMVMIR